MGQALPKPALRPFLAADTPVLAAIFAAAIEQLTGDDYTEEQQQAWASAADDEDEFGKRLAGALTLVATLQNSPVGFASLKGPNHIDMLYVHPGAVGQGVAAMLIDALERLAGGRGAKTLPATTRSNSSPSADMSPSSATPCPATVNGWPTPRWKRHWPAALRKV
jgi:putative acetyltransferase